MVYLAEAHATDEWPMGTVPIAQAKSMADRITAARRFRHDTGFTWPTACDAMDDGFYRRFGAWPTRFYVLEDSELVFKIELDRDRLFDTDELRAWIENRLE